MSYPYLSDVIKAPVQDRLAVLGLSGPRRHRAAELIAAVLICAGLAGVILLGRAKGSAQAAAAAASNA